MGERSAILHGNLREGGNNPRVNQQIHEIRSVDCQENRYNLVTRCHILRLKMHQIRFLVSVRKAGTHYPYVRAVRNDRTYGPYVRASFFCARTPVRTVDPYGPQDWIFDTRKGHPYVRPVEDTRTIPEALLRNLWRYIVNKFIEAKSILFLLKKQCYIYFIKQDNARDIRLQWRQSLDFLKRA